MNHKSSLSLLAYYRSTPDKILLLRMLVVSGSSSACSRNSRAVVRDQMVSGALLGRSTGWQCENEFRTRITGMCILHVKFLVINKLLINQVCHNVISVSSNIFM
jgi:hypothetical protein